MNLKTFFSRNWPHFAIIALFIIIVASYFKLQFQGYGLKQHDVEQWLGMAHEIQDYRDSNGEEILWTNSMFGGMPSVQISIIYAGNYIRSAFNLFFDFFEMPAGAVLLSMIGFYLACIMLRISPWIGLIGALAFGFTSYDIIILQAGHNTKAIAIAFMAPTLGAFIMAYRINMKWGAIITALFLLLQIGSNHLQVTYYFGILLLFIAIAFMIEAIRKKEIRKFLITSGWLALAGLFAVVTNYANIALTNEYAKYTIRGGNDVTIQPDGSENVVASEGGLDKEYITQWSYGVGESFTLLSPNVKGGGSFGIAGSQFEDVAMEVDMNSQERNVVMSSPVYWGEQPFTSGPVYIGAVVLFLAMLGMVFLKGKLKWGLLAASILALMLSWGKNFMGLTEFFIDHVPGYNKFRTVTIILVIIQLTMPFLGVLFLNELYKQRESLKEQKKKFLIASGSFAGFVLLVWIIGLGDNYTSANDQRQMDNIEQNFYQQLIKMDPATLQAQYGLNINDQAQVEQFIQAQSEPYIAGFQKMKEVRSKIFSKSMMRTFLFVLVAAGLVALIFYSTVKIELVFGGLALLVLIDLMPVANQYLGNQDAGSGYKYWEEKGLAMYPVESSPANEMIMEQELSANPSLASKIAEAEKLGQNKATELEASGALRQRIIDSYRFMALNRNTNYRVFDFNGAFSSSQASYFHKSLGGYHGAKLRSIQNLFEFHLRNSNNSVFDMMNVKYFIQNGENGPVARMNPTALGNAWFVKDLKVVESANEEIQSLGSTFILANQGTGTLLVNGTSQKSAKVAGTETIQYVLGGDTMSVGMSNGMSEGMKAVFVMDTNGRTNLVPEQTLEMDPFQSFRRLVGITLENKFNPGTEAYILKDQAKGLSTSYSGEGTITMTKYHPMNMEYASESSEKQFAVFSEVYYPIGWTAYIDNKEVEIHKVNYLLRGIEIPKGKHKIEMRYSSESLSMYNTISASLSTLFLLLIGFFLWQEYKKKKELKEA